jgi:hypothetical protein
MTKSSKGIIEELLDIRANLIELVLITILLSISINIISSELPIAIGIPTIWNLAFGVAIGIFVVGYSLNKLSKNRKRSRLYEGFFIYEKTRNLVLNIPRYRYGEGISSFLKAAFIEDENLEKVWNNIPLSKQVTLLNGRPFVKRLESHQIIVEATEYFLIDALAVHLSSYFNDGFSRHQLVSLLRNDIPADILSNRFLSIFSKPIQERPKFHRDETDGLIDMSGELVYAKGIEGALYKKFELILPATSQMKRKSEKSFEIKDKMFKICFTIDFDGCSPALEPEFPRYYLGIDHISELTPFMVTIKIDIKFNYRAFVSPQGWQYYYWVDSFLRELTNLIDRDKFLDSIGWEQMLTLFDYIKVHNHKS